MADNTINVRIKQKIDTESNWSKNNPVLLKGEKGLIEGTGKYKIGNGTSKWSDLPLYEGMTASDRSKLNSIASGATKVTVDSALSSTSTNPVQNKVINSALAGKSNTNHTHDLSAMINTLSTGTATPTDDDYYVSQYSSGGTTTTTYHRRPMKALFEYIKGKLSTVAVSGSYNDLSNKPTIPTVGNGTVTIKQAGTSKGTFTMNQSGNTTIELTDNNSWRGIQDNLTSTSTSDSLSANQGKILNESKLMHKTINTSKTDLNTLTETGIYHIVITDALNSPSSNHGTLYVDTTVGTKYQVFMSDNVTNYMHKRYYDNTNKKWLGWTQLKLTDTVYTHPSYTAKSNGLYKVTVDSIGHVSGATAVTKSDITALGIPSTNTTYSTGTSSTSGLTKLYTGTGTATDGTMTQAAIKSALDGKSDSSHLHSQYYDSKISRTKNTVLAAPNGSDGGAVFRKLETADLPGTYAGSSTAGGAAVSANKINPTVTFTCGDNNNTTGYRLIATVSLGKWSNYRATFITCSRHQGYGFISIGFGCNNSTISQANGYAEIKYYGLTSSASVISKDAFQIYISADGTKAYVFWKYWDYSACDIIVLKSDFTISNGTWMTGISSDYGARKAQVDINAASSADSVPWSGITGKPSTFTPSSHTHDDRYYTESEVDSKLSGKANTSHTHTISQITDIANASVKAATTATTATKLSSSAGSANQPVYFSDGKPVAGTYTLGKSVPSDAKFTDTVYTHPTYTAKASGLYKVTVDATGHVSATAAVTKADITGLGIPGTDTNTDTKVTQNAVKDSDYTNWRSLVWGSSNSATEGFTPTTVTDQLFSSTNLSVQPSSGTIKATTFKGSLNGTASNASKVNNHTVNSDVPSGAKFTDTVYTHPTTSGNKHIPSGGSAGQILRWSADGTAVWGADNNTTYNDATTSARGLMTAAMVTKLNGIATNANNYSLPTASSSTLGGVKTTSTVTDTSGYSPCPIISGVPYYRNPLAQKEYTLSNISGTLAVSKGGTGATSASTGRANLGAVNFVCQKTEPEDGDQNVGDLWFAEE